MRTTIDIAEYRRQLATCKRSAWRFEQQPSYWVGYERELFDRFLAGDPESPEKNADLKGWFDRVRAWTAEGKAVGRVRIVDDPPTDYQRWMQWMDRWNREAGEAIDYLGRAEALAAKVLPGIGPQDWWLVDDARLMLMHFDEDARWIKTELLVDEKLVNRAVRLRHRAIAAVQVKRRRPRPTGPTCSAS